jgi:hypothetical protein
VGGRDQHKKTERKNREGSRRKLVTGSASWKSICEFVKSKNRLASTWVLQKQIGTEFGGQGMRSEQNQTQREV